MLRHDLVAVLATIATLSVATALAQDQPVAPAQRSRDCMPSPGMNDPTPNETRGNPPLSDQFSPSKGVVCPPPGIDPDISAPPPGGAKTPVILPPGAPGGGPSTQPG
jgi:hypothetical protein